MTNNANERDAVAKARALLAELDDDLATFDDIGPFAPYHIWGEEWGTDIGPALRALADECDALRNRVAALEDDGENYIDPDPRWERVRRGTATDDDYAQLIAEYDAPPAADAPPRETGQDISAMDIYEDDGSELHVGASHEMTKPQRKRARKGRKTDGGIAE